LSPADEPAFGEEDISLRGCVDGTRGLVALGLVGSIAAALLAVVTGDARWGMAVVMVPIGVLVLGPVLWLRWLSPAPHQRRRYFAALGLGCAWAIASMTTFFVVVAILAT
jgi:hypothetical protein